MSYSYNSEFDNYIRWWVGQVQFRDAVRAAVNDELFWRNLFEGDRFRKEMDKIPTKVHTAIQSEMPSLRSNVESLATNTVRNTISTEILKQLPTIIGQNHQFVELFQKHRDELNSMLHSEVTKIVDSIVSDPNYHTVNERYFEQFRQKGDQQLASQERRFGEFASRVNQEWSTQRQQITYQVNAELGSITSLGTRCSTLENRVTMLESEKNELKNTNTWMKVGLATSFGCIAYLGYNLHKVSRLF